MSLIQLLAVSFTRQNLPIMNINKKRHELLSLLYKKRADAELRRSDNIIGVSFEEIEKSLNLTQDELLIVTSELIELEEISFHDASGIKGLFCSKKGATSFANKKYLRANNARIKNDIKDIVQIIIPVLSLIITVMVIALNSSEKTKEIKAIEQKVELLEKQIDSWETIPKKLF